MTSVWPKGVPALVLIMAVISLSCASFSEPAATEPPAAAVFDIRTFGARGDDSTDDTAAIQRAIDAAAEADGATVRLSKGLFHVNSTLELKSGVTLTGQGGKTVLFMPAREHSTPLLYADRGENVTVEDLVLRSEGPHSEVYAISMTGQKGSTLRNLRIENVQVGVKLGSGDLSANWVVSDLVVQKSRLPFFVADVHDSTFRRIRLEGGAPPGERPVNAYIHNNVQDCVFEDFSLTRPAGHALQVWPEGTETLTARLVFRRVLVDASASGYPLALGGDGSAKVEDIEFHDLTAVGANRRDRAIFMLSEPAGILVDGFNARGSDFLVRQYRGANANEVVFMNGNFVGERFEYGSPAITNLTIDGSVSLNGSIRSSVELPRSITPLR